MRKELSKKLIQRPLMATAVSFLFFMAGQVTAAEIPVIQGAAGFGITTPAGRGGKVYVVDKLASAGPGSLKACVDAEGPRVCVFEVSGTIQLDSELRIRNPNITIAGQTAPSPGIMIRGAGLYITASDVLVQHISVRVGDDPDGPHPDNRDALRIESVPTKPISNIIIDHCSFSWSIDEVASVYVAAGNVSFLNSIFAEPLDHSKHTKGHHGFGVLFGSKENGVGNISIIGNLMAHQIARNPLSRAPNMVMVNNVVYNRNGADVDFQSENSPTNNTIVGNVFLRGPDHNSRFLPIQADPEFSPIISYARPLVVGSKLFVSDNQAVEATTDPWSLVQIREPGLGLTRQNWQVFSPPTWPKNLVAIRTANNAVLDSVLKNAGSRPADRNKVDVRIIKSVQEGNGQVINCVSANGTERCKKNAGGWPVMAENRRDLNPPDKDANQIEANGYTKLENWLHAMAADVEGRSRPVITPAPVVNLTSAAQSIVSGTSTNLSWSTVNATACTASEGWADSKTPSGGQSTGTLTKTTDFTLTCTGAGGTASDSIQVAVTTPPPQPAPAPPAVPKPVIHLTSTPASVVSGGSANLNWTSTHARTCTASGGWSGQKSPSFSGRSTGPLTKTTTYTLTCTGQGGTTSDSITVTVRAR